MQKCIYANSDGFLGGENILQILISTPFTSIKTLNLEPSLNQTQFERHALPLVCKCLKYNARPVLYLQEKGDSRTLSLIFSPCPNYQRSAGQAYLKIESMCLGRHVSCQKCKLRDSNGMAGEAPVSRRGHPSAQRQAERQPHGTHLQMTACHWQEIHHTALSPLT